MSTITDFDPSPPSPYSGNWQDAVRADKESSSRFTTYQAPEGKPIPFILESFDFSGGQSVDTAEYPFGGYWSNESLNEKTQQLSIEGFLRGANYIEKRNALIQALRVKTDDDNPAYIDFPFWGRFPVVVLEYKIGEKSGELGQCAVSLTFARAGVTISERLAAVIDTAGLFESAKETLKAAAIEDFGNKLKNNSDNDTLASSCKTMKQRLLDIVGRIQAGKTQLSVLSSEVSGFVNLINQGIRGPAELASALLSSIEAITGSIKSIGQTFQDTYLGKNNEKNALLLFLAAGDYTLGTEAATIAAQNTIEASENLYRTAAFLAASTLLLSARDLSYENATNYWKLLQKLEERIDRDNTQVHAAIEALRIAVSQSLSTLELSNEMKYAVKTPLPLLYLSHYLGCDTEKLRRLNSIADSFVVKGDVTYV